MLASLSVRDVVLIERLDMTFAPGLSVLTGETGAGKSILLDALGLALGMRGDSGLVRPGARQASVTASFELPADHPARHAASEHGIAEDGGPLILRRMIAEDGRGRAFVNDQPVSVGLLRRIGACLVEIEGQFEQHGLLDAGTHRDLLDAFAGAENLASDVAEAWRRLAEARRSRTEAEVEVQRIRADEAFLRHAVSELDQFAPQIGEEAELAELRRRLMNREKILDAITAAGQEIGGERGIERALNAARRPLDRLGDTGGAEVAAALAALDRAAAELSEGVEALRHAAAASDLDPQRLHAAEERLFALRELARKHRVEVDGLPALRGSFAERLAALDDRDGTIATLTRAETEATAAYRAVAEKLSKTRAETAKRLDRAVTGELKALKLEKARFRTALERLPEQEWRERGLESVGFTIATNPGQDLAPLARVASGGELSRILLAIKVSLARVHPVPTLVFDEVDAGVGGATAAAVGERLQLLARAVQVLVVTHSPQVAALGRHHWRASKDGGAGGVRTKVAALDPEERREEIARMLSAAEITSEALAQADRLLASAERAA